MGHGWRETTRDCRPQICVLITNLSQVRLFAGLCILSVRGRESFRPRTYLELLVSICLTEPIAVAPDPGINLTTSWD